MRNIITLLVLFYFCSCNQSKQTIRFKTVDENELNFPADTTFATPHGKIWDERKRIHDSCMGSSYAVNAVFMRTRDTIPLGSIVDMKTMKVISRFPFFDDSASHFSSIFGFETKPCYEKREMSIPVDSFMNHSILFKIDSSSDKINNELLEAVRGAVHTEIETGSWLNMEITDALGAMLDTTTDKTLLKYKKALLTPGNIVLMRSSSVTEISFYFHTKNPLPNDLLKKLMNKPVSIEQPFFRSQLFYIDNTNFGLRLNGLFQVIGQFMKCELQ